MRASYFLFLSHSVMFVTLRVITAIEMHKLVRSGRKTSTNKQRSGRTTPTYPHEKERFIQ